MAKASIRQVISKDAWLSDGRGLDGSGPFISGSALIFPAILSYQWVNIDVPQVEIRSILVKEGHCSATLRMTEKTENVTIGASTNNGSFLSINVMSDVMTAASLIPTVRTIKFTGTDGKELETADNKLTGIEKNKNEFTYLSHYQLGQNKIEIQAEDGGTQKFINTNFTSITMEGLYVNGITEFNIITSCDWLAPNDHSQLSYSGLAAQKINIGKAHKPAIFHIKLNADLALLSSVILPTLDQDPELPSVQRGVINFLDKTSTLTIDNSNEKEYKLFLKAPLDPGENNQGIVYLKGKLKILDQSLGTAEHKLATLGCDEYNSAQLEDKHFQAFFTHLHKMEQHAAAETHIIGAEQGDISAI